MKSVLIVLISCLIVLSQQYGQNQKPEIDWSSESEWRPEQDWRPEQEWKPESVPKPENKCKRLLPNASTTEFTPIVVLDVAYDEIIVCDSTSKLKQILYTTTGATQVTCNGIVVNSDDTSCNITYVGGGHGGKSTELVKLVDYTLIISFNNGNWIIQECGTIANGRCSGDILFGTGSFQANDQNGCCKNGVDSFNAIARSIVVKGKCNSRCSLGKSVYSYPEPVSNAGLADRRLVVETHE